MANYYLDFVGLNTFIYETVGYENTDVGDSERISFYNNAASSPLSINHFGMLRNNSDSIPNTIGGYKNYKFSHELPNTASFFPALMLHRNGPYGFPMWKQIRVGQNPLTRKQVKNNTFTFVTEPGPTIVIDGSNYTGRYGNIQIFSESPVLSRYMPIQIRGASSVISERTGRTSIERFTINSSFGNSLAHFDNEEVDKKFNFVDQADETYDEIKELYLNDGLDSPDSPMDIFEFVKYSETVYPKQIYSNKSYTRQRTNFNINWRSKFDDREVADKDNGFGYEPLSSSIWPLDFDPSASSTNGGLDRARYYYGVKRAAGFAHGILQNNYSYGSEDGMLSVISNMNDYLRPAPIYARKHDTTPSASVVAPTGMLIEGINVSASTCDGAYNNMNHNVDLPQGEIFWDAPSQAGKGPFYDSYDHWVDGPRQKGKGYTIVPEFRISNHVSTLITQGYDTKIDALLELTGGLSTADSSDDDTFYKVYSTSDFLKHFDLVKDDHKDFVAPTKVKLKCKAIKKFLPYNGFYPCQRTVDIAKQFYSSYEDGITISEGSSFGIDNKHGLQNLLTPLFAPGVLFNAIKSGVAVDYPIATGSIRGNDRIHQDGDDYYLHPFPAGEDMAPDRIFTKRVPFNALIEPQRYLSQLELFNNEPHSFASMPTTCFWDGTGDNLYKMMTHNFLAEVSNFFLQGQQNSMIFSRPSNDPRVGNAKAGLTYSMRVKMYKTIDGAIQPAQSGSGLFFVPPQYSSSVGVTAAMRENFTMYSRPSAFGPPTRVTSSAYNFRNVTGSDSSIGENYPFTPPYYHGQGWADIKFTPTETKKYTIDEIIREVTASYTRYVHEDSAIGDGDSYAGGVRASIINNLYNQDAMQLSASLNLFGQGQVKSVDLLDDSTSDKVNVAVDISSDNKAQWIIQPYFETPMLNFVEYGQSGSLSLPTYGSQSAPRGMWHQYGRIETDPAKGIFMQVTDIPEGYRANVSGSILEGSLKDLCGFKDEPVRLGQTANSKQISEAVVAVPFIEKDGERKFFKIERNTITMATEARAMSEGVVGDSILHMVDMMQKFVIPPSMDFVHRQELDPFAMYIFEFTHTLSQQDLADIWQNLLPDVGESFSESTVEIAHDMLAHELLGGGEMVKNQQRKIGNPLPDKVQWMVFKAKQRAEMNYYNTIVGEQNTTVAGTKRKDFTTRRLAKQAAGILRPDGFDADLSYNWPYDFFSLVELVKLDAEFTLADTETMNDEENNIVVKRGSRGISGLPPRALQRIGSNSGNNRGGGGQGR